MRFGEGVTKYLTLFVKWIEDHSIMFTTLIILLGVVDGLSSMYFILACPHITEANPFHTLFNFDVVTALGLALVTRSCVVTIVTILLNMDVHPLIKTVLATMLLTWLSTSIYTLIHNVDIVCKYCV